MDAASLFTGMVTFAGGAMVLFASPEAIAVQPASPVIDTTLGTSGSIKIERGRDGRLFVLATVNGEPLRFLLDTGANHTVLSGRDADTLGITSMGETRLNTVGGSVIGGHGSAQSIALGSKRFVDARVLIVRNLEHSLLGMDVLGELEGFSIILAPASPADMTSR